jgi:saccharopepsin
MFLSTLAPLLLLPFAVANGVHRLKLKKLPISTNNHPSHEIAYLAEKYGAQSYSQVPLMGAGGAGRRVSCPSNKAGKDLFWTQAESQGGHNVPLSSA